MRELVVYMAEREYIDPLKLHASSCNNYDFGKMMFDSLNSLKEKKKVQSVLYEWTLLPKDYLSLEIIFNDAAFVISK